MHALEGGRGPARLTANIQMEGIGASAAGEKQWAGHHVRLHQRVVVDGRVGLVLEHWKWLPQFGCGTLGCMMRCGGQAWFLRARHCIPEYDGLAL